MNINSDYSYDASYYNRLRQQRAAQSEMGVNAGELMAFSVGYNQQNGAELNTSTVMESYDTDGDGSLSESELEQLLTASRPYPKERFQGMPAIQEEIDTDGDLLWSADELTQFVDKLNEASGNTLDVESLLSEYDLDGDGSLNESEQAEMMGGIMPPPPPPMQEQAAVSEADRYAALREKITEIYNEIQDTLTKKEEELRAVETSNEESSLAQLLLEQRAMKATASYEQSFLFDDLLTGLFQSNA